MVTSCRSSTIIVTDRFNSFTRGELSSTGHGHEFDEDKN